MITKSQKQIILVENARLLAYWNTRPRPYMKWHGVSKRQAKACGTGTGRGDLKGGRVEVGKVKWIPTSKT